MFATRCRCQSQALPAYGKAAPYSSFWQRQRDHGLRLPDCLAAPGLGAHGCARERAGRWRLTDRAWRARVVGAGRGSRRAAFGMRRRVHRMERVDASSPLGGSAHSLWKTLWTASGAAGGRRRGQPVDNRGIACGGTTWSLGTAPWSVDIHCANPQRHPQDLHRSDGPLTCENVSYPQHPQALLPPLKEISPRKIKN
ncbi:hypothetical protein FRACA_70037 [Frankia canadensis]|uniref:Uncharacterized protein n=1 Tax=Frankia canadensis TaxID=1836972 RepID=A0A2I2L0H3_9ACTN|nr:hypothetical protein FRACA_70037 [Frankia canadensis]SOU58711.1 hypothetical protein FRACA_70037 [Frankia canadensis]